MKYIVNNQQAKMIDSLTSRRTGIPSLVLMERASLSVAERIEAMICGRPELKNRMITAVCGSGNNGGDGVCVARILHNRGYKVQVYLAGNRDKMTEDLKTQIRIAENLRLPFVKEITLDTGIIIDALFGVGLTRDVEGLMKDKIREINAAAGRGCMVVSVDLPSGINGDNGRVMGLCVKADETVTFGYIKLGIALYPGRSYAGHVSCPEIGFDESALSEFDHFYLAYEDCDIREMLPRRLPDGHKGSFGHVLIAAGSKNMAGAAALAAKAAYKSGCGLVTILTPECNRVIIQSLIPEAVLKTFSEDEEEDVTEVVKDALRGKTAVVCGPGIGLSEAAERMVEAVLSFCKVPLILDADALNILSEHQEWMALAKGPVILTPHMKELSRLTGETIQTLKRNLEDVCTSFCQENSVICIAKDACTCVFGPGNEIIVNMSGNDGMAVGGSGDVLAGLTGGLCAQGMNVSDAAGLSVFIHGRAGDAVSHEYGRRSMLSGDLVGGIAAVLQDADS